MPQVSRRRLERHAFAGVLEVVWKKRMASSVVNANSGGLQLELGEPLEVGSTISFRGDPFDGHATASVRYCVPHQGHWLSGIEAEGGVRLRRPRVLGRARIRVLERPAYV